MLINQNPQEKRKNLKTCLNSGKLLRFPGSFSPFVAKLIENEGFDGVYVSGASLSADMGLPDIGLTSQTEVVTRSGQIAKATMLPTIVDADTGFGEPINAARTITLLEEAGVSGCHIEDQRNPKRCGQILLQDQNTIYMYTTGNISCKFDSFHHDSIIPIAQLIHYITASFFD